MRFFLSLYFALFLSLLLLVFLHAAYKNGIIWVLGESAILLFIASPVLLIAYVVSAGIKFVKAGDAEKEKIGQGLDAGSSGADNQEKARRRNELILAVLVAAGGLFFFYKGLMFLGRQ